MKRNALMLLLAVTVVGCGTTAIQREMQVAKGIKSANETAATALDWGILTADEGQKIQDATRATTKGLKAAIAARRAGEPDGIVNAYLTAVEASLIDVLALIESFQKGDD